MKKLHLTRTALAVLTHSVAGHLQHLARHIEPNLPDRVYFTKDYWYYLPGPRHLALNTCTTPERVQALHRYPGVTLAVIKEPNGELSALFLRNANESPYVMYGRDEDGYETQKEPPPDPDPDPHHHHYDAILRKALDRTPRDPSTLN